MSLSQGFDVFGEDIFFPFTTKSQAAQIMGLNRSSSSITKLPTTVAACQHQIGQENMCLFRANHKERAEYCFRLKKKKKKKLLFCRSVDQSTMYLYFRGLRKSIETRYIIAAQEAEKLYFSLCCYWHSSHWFNVLLLLRLESQGKGLPPLLQLNSWFCQDSSAPWGWLGSDTPEVCHHCTLFPAGSRRAAGGHRDHWQWPG